MYKKYSRCVVLFCSLLMLFAATVCRGDDFTGGMMEANEQTRDMFEIVKAKEFWLEFNGGSTLPGGGLTHTRISVVIPIEGGNDYFSIFFPQRREQASSVIEKLELYKKDSDETEVLVSNSRGYCSTVGSKEKVHYPCRTKLKFDFSNSFDDYRNFVIRSYDDSDKEMVMIDGIVPNLMISLDKSDSEGPYDKLVFTNNIGVEIMLEDVKGRKGYVKVIQAAGDDLTILEGESIEFDLKIDAMGNVKEHIVDETIEFKYKRVKDTSIFGTRKYDTALKGEYLIVLDDSNPRHEVVVEEYAQKEVEIIAEKDQLSAEKDQLAIDHAQDIEDLKEAHRREIEEAGTSTDELRNSHKAAMAALAASQAQEIEDLQEEHETRVSEAKEAINRGFMDVINAKAAELTVDEAFRCANEGEDVSEWLACILEKQNELDMFGIKVADDSREMDGNNLRGT